MVLHFDNVKTIISDFLDAPHKSNFSFGPKFARTCKSAVSDCKLAGKYSTFFHI